MKTVFFFYVFVVVVPLLCEENSYVGFRLGHNKSRGNLNSSLTFSFKIPSNDKRLLNTKLENCWKEIVVYQNLNLNRRILFDMYISFIYKRGTNGNR